MASALSFAIRNPATTVMGRSARIDVTLDSKIGLQTLEIQRRAGLLTFTLFGKSLKIPYEGPERDDITWSDIRRPVTEAIAKHFAVSPDLITA